MRSTLRLCVLALNPRCPTRSERKRPDGKENSAPSPAGKPKSGELKSEHKSHRSKRKSPIEDHLELAPKKSGNSRNKSSKNNHHASKPRRRVLAALPERAAAGPQSRPQKTSTAVPPGASDNSSLLELAKQALNNAKAGNDAAANIKICVSNLRQLLDSQSLSDRDKEECCELAMVARETHLSAYPGWDGEGFKNLSKRFSADETSLLKSEISLTGTVKPNLLCNGRYSYLSMMKTKAGY